MYSGLSLIIAPYIFVFFIHIFFLTFLSTFSAKPIFLSVVSLFLYSCILTCNLVLFQTLFVFLFLNTFLLKYNFSIEIQRIGIKPYHTNCNLVHFIVIKSKISNYKTFAITLTLLFLLFIIFKSFQF